MLIYNSLYDDISKADERADEQAREERWAELVQHLIAFAESETWAGAVSALGQAMRENARLKKELNDRR